MTDIRVKNMINELDDADYKAAIRRFAGFELTEEEKKRCKKYDEVKKRDRANRKAFREELIRKKNSILHF